MIFHGRFMAAKACVVKINKYIYICIKLYKYWLVENGIASSWILIVPYILFGIIGS